MASTWPPRWPSPASELYSFDLNGDVLFVLSRWTVSHDNSDEEYDNSDASTLSSLNSDDEDMDSEMNPDTLSDQTLPELSNDAMEIDKTSKEDATQTPGVTTTVHMRVSSRHMSLGSQAFLSMLGPAFKEGRDLQAHGSVVIPLPDDDPDVMIILLNIIHGKTRNVPREIELHVLAQLATLVDYYNMHEIVELWSDTWIEIISLDECLFLSDHNKEDSDLCQPDALKRLFISWVFQKSAAFRNISREIERSGAEEMTWEDGSDYEIELEDLEKFPLPEPIIDAMNLKRRVAINKANDIVQDIVDNYSDSTIHCPNAGGSKCDATVLGSFIKHTSITGLWPPPEYMADDSFKEVAGRLRAIEIITSCVERAGEPKLEHGLDSFIEASLLTIEDCLYGLDIQDYTPKDRARLQV